MSWKRAAPLTGIAFVVFFIASVAVSSVPSTARDTAWLAAYATHAKQAGHLATGVLLVLAAISLMSFLSHLWTRIADARAPEAISPLPIIAAGVSAACIMVGGVVMAAVSGSALLYSQPLPGADVLRLTDSLGFAIVSVAGMPAAAVSIAGVSLQARSAGVFSVRLTRLGLVVAAVLLAAVAFVPILALLVWLIVITVVLMRQRAARERRRPDPWPTSPRCRPALSARAPSNPTHPQIRKKRSCSDVPSP